MDYTSIIGYLAALLTTAAFLPQALKTFREKSAKDISLAMYIVFETGIFFWFIYGILNMQWPIILANSVTIILSTMILYMKIRYK